MKIQETDAWKAAEHRYSAIQAALMMPFAGLARSPGEIIEELEDIARECPEFYPAVLESSLRRMIAGTDRCQAEQIETGLRLMLDVGDPQNAEVEAINLHDNLENLWRFDLCQRCLEIQRYLARHGGNFSDYLVRPVDREEIERLSDREELEKLDQLCTGFGRRCAASGRD
jgi:hypothetical protein